MNVNDVIQKYIELRDQKTALKKTYDDSVEAIDTKMKKIESVFLKHFEQTGQTQAKTPAGTAFTKQRVSDKVIDRDAYLQFVLENNATDFLESRVNKSTLDQYIEKYNDLPPGVSRTTELVVNIRRS